MSFTPAPQVAIQLLNWCRDKSAVARAAVSLAHSFTLPVNCSISSERLNHWLSFSNAIQVPQHTPVTLDSRLGLGNACLCKTEIKRRS